MARKSKRHRDVCSAGSSPVTKHLVNEEFDVRHRERLRLAHSCREEVRASIESLGLVFKQNDQHWRVYFPDVQGRSPLIEWWPSTAKCVVFQRWGSGIHVHDARQFVEIVKKLVHGGVVIDGIPVSYAKCAHAIASINPFDFKVSGK